MYGVLRNVQRSAGRDLELIYCVYSVCIRRVRTHPWMDTCPLDTCPGPLGYALSLINNSHGGRDVTGRTSSTCTNMYNYQLYVVQYLKIKISYY